jgi:predicted NBD/HSP70 family sugar kinase
MEHHIAPTTQRSVRRHNLGVVLRAVAEGGPRWRATLATDTGLNKSTVSSLVAELIDLGLLAERGAERRGSVGRPGLAVEIAEDGAVALGLEVGVDWLAVHAADLTGTVRLERREGGDLRGRPVTAVLDQLAEMTRAALDELRAAGMRPAGAVVALPGLVDARAGTLLVAPNLGWNDVAVRAELGERIGDSLPLEADNEANLSALAELWEGAGRGVRDFLHVSGEVGIGAGVVIGGRLLRGAHGFGGEFGHVTVDPGGPLCACGSRGCLESRAGLEAILGAAGITGNAAPAARAGELAERARAGDADALAALHEAGRWLGVAAGSAANLLDLSAIVIGGALGPLAEWLAEPLERELRTRVLAASWAVPSVLPARLGPEAAVRGAATQVLRRVLEDPASVRTLV